ncbi:MAG: pyridoxamine kinase [Oscillospiraceae bacterium]|nr:pyridoxamine kinase [Oscillospiraceae bacterium]MBQ8172061.1 pyridoxamine kinase [Oscillospiraceae bacterium]
MKRIVTIQDFSCVGKCSLTSALPVISAAGVEACGIPTALLSNHTGFPTFYSRDLTEELTPIGAQLRRESIGFDAVYTGYIASVRQMELISDFIDEFRGANTLIFVDPVMGDNGRIYSGLSGDYPQHMKKLCQKADILAPNLTEACLLLGKEYNADIPYEEICRMLRELYELCGKYAFITGVKRDDMIGAVGFDGVSFNDCFMIHEDIVCAGTGDILSAAFIGAVMRGAQFSEALDTAVKFTYEAVRLTAADPDRRFYGVQFELALPYYIEQIGKIVENGRV